MFSPGTEPSRCFRATLLLAALVTLLHVALPAHAALHAHDGDGIACELCDASGADAVAATDIRAGGVAASALPRPDAPRATLPARNPGHDRARAPPTLLR